MEKPPEKIHLGYDHLLEHAFRMASNAERDRKAVLAADFLSTGKDIPALTGLSDLIGTEYRDLYYYFQASSTGRFADQAAGMIERVRRCLRAQHAEWAKIQPALAYLWGSFFGGQAVDRNWPGFMILMPDGYVTTRHSFSRRKEETKIPKPEIVRAVSGPMLTLEFGRLWPKFDIPFDVMRLPLRFPNDRDRKWARPVIRHRVRRYDDGTGHQRPGEIIFQLGRADPDDERVLKAGHYYPNTEGRRVYGDDGSVCFTRKMTVLVLARLVPNPSAYSAIIHQLCISLDEEYSSLMDINCLVREFAQFAKHYPGISELIEASLIP